MLIKSARQFRSYVISLFLLISGLIVTIGGVSIYKATQTHLIKSLKHEKLIQVSAIASLIDGNKHASIKNPWSYKKQNGKALSGTLNRVIEKEADKGQKIYTLNYNKDHFSYAVAPQIAATDTILITTNDIEICLIKNSQGELKLIYLGQERDSFNLISNTNSFNVQLSEAAKRTLLLINGQPIFFINHSNQLIGHFKNIVLSSNSAKSQIIVYKLGDKKVNVKYHFIPEGKALRLPGLTFIVDDLINDKFYALINDKQRKSGLIVENKQGGFYVVAPIANKINTNVGLLVLQVPQQILDHISDDILKSMLKGFAILMIFLLLAAIYFARKITSPIEQLTQAIARLIHQDFNFKLSPKGFGRLGFLAKQFNQMLSQLQNSRSELITLNRSYSRFVPHQLLKQLSEKGVNDIALGDSCERLMTIMFCDIRGFTTLSEAMSPTENFRFINRYLTRIAPVINDHGGIIDKYMGDGIMALFPNSADHAVKASIEMINALDRYNQKLIQKKLPPIAVGIGLHTGKTMLGTVGTTSRMDATVVSDAVNATARIEALNKSFSTQILISEETKRNLSDISQYKIRYIASCEIRGKFKPMTLYEIFDNDPASLQKEKLNNQTTMIRAWSAYKSGDSAMAIQMYQRLAENSPLDKSLDSLIERCQSGRL